MAKISRIILIIKTDRTFGRDLVLGVGQYAHIHGQWVFYRNPIFTRKFSKAEIPSVSEKFMGPLKQWNGQAPLLPYGGNRPTLSFD